MEASGLYLENDRRYRYLLLPSGMLVGINDLEEVVEILPDGNLEDLETVLDDLQTQDLNLALATTWNLILHISLYRKYLLTHQQENRLGEAIIELNQLYPDSKPKEVPIYRTTGREDCSKLYSKDSVLSINGILDNISVNYLVFPSGILIKFQTDLTDEEDFAWIVDLGLDVAAICQELADVQELESYPPKLIDVQGMLLGIKDMKEITEEEDELLSRALNELEF